MTYMVIRPGAAEPELLPGTPSVERLSELVGGTPDLIRTGQDTDLAFWCNADFAALNLRRNVLGTVLAVMTGAPTDPYAGTLVATELDQLGGFLPRGLDLMMSASVSEAAHDVAAVLGLTDAEPIHPVPAAVTAEMLELAGYAQTAPFRQPEVVTSVDLDRFLRSILGP